MSRSILWLAPLLVFFACDDADDSEPVDAPRPDTGAPASPAPDSSPPKPCDDAARVGGFSVVLTEAYTAVQGQIADGSSPLSASVVVAAEGACTLLRPPSFDCAEPCESGTTCGPDGACVDQPVNVDVGTVSIGGLEAPVEMTARAPVWFYTHTGAMPHPGVWPDAVVALDATGGDRGPFAMTTGGIAPLEVDADAVPLSRDAPTRVRWRAAVGDAWIHIDLNIANHGGTPGRIECDVADTGEHELPKALTDALLDGGYSGFPALALTRHRAASVELDIGCVDLQVRSQVVLGVDIAGLVSCSGDEDCPNEQRCQADLSCGI